MILLLPYPQQDVFSLNKASVVEKVCNSSIGSNEFSQREVKLFHKHSFENSIMCPFYSIHRAIKLIKSSLFIVYDL